jgi:AraC-like DNA-binding protein
MKTNQQATDQKINILPFPLRNAGKVRSADPTEMLKSEPIGRGLNANNASVTRPAADYAVGSIGRIKMVATRTTPCISIADDPKFITLALLYAGDRYRYCKGTSMQYIAPGDIHLCLRTGGTAHIGYFSGIICEIELARLERAMRAIGGEVVNWNQQRSYVLKRRRSSESFDTQRQLWSLFSFIDKLLGESKYLATGLGLDEQVYRHLSLHLFQEEGVLDKIQKTWRDGGAKWSSILDELVDYIRQNAHLNLTLTDLEEQSHYSGRHLQNLFHEKFDCTPMQFVRRQRLSAAMERLQTAGEYDTVTNVARDFGYAYTSSFTTDFHREFGVTPSVVLRSTRGGVEKAPSTELAGNNKDYADLG